MTVEPKPIVKSIISEISINLGSSSSDFGGSQIHNIFYWSDDKDIFLWTNLLVFLQIFKKTSPFIKSFVKSKASFKFDIERSLSRTYKF